MEFYYTIALFTMVGIKFSLIMMERICFQSVVLSPSSRQMDSRASLTAAGGLAMDRTSTRCCFLMDLTAKLIQQEAQSSVNSEKVKKNSRGEVNKKLTGDKESAVNGQGKSELGKKAKNLKRETQKMEWVFEPMKNCTKYHILVIHQRTSMKPIFILKF
uniref:Uncharacterized protein n=1 Tax=Scleropages formosus TaxID=113540 RepID=A0A8C9RY25_SCLFO